MAKKAYRPKAEREAQAKLVPKQIEMALAAYRKTQLKADRTLRAELLKASEQPALITGSWRRWWAAQVKNMQENWGYQPNHPTTVTTIQTAFVQQLGTLATKLRGLTRKAGQGGFI